MTYHPESVPAKLPYNQDTMENAEHPSSRAFLSAEWRDLLLLNYEVDPRLLRPHVPPGTELDSFNGRSYASLVGFRFLRTRLAGIFPVPLHTNFDEVNLRFYVRRSVAGEIRRGVVFIREIVPRRAIALAANLIYSENYIRLPMRHRVEKAETAIAAEYAWRVDRNSACIRAQSTGTPALAAEASLEQFITEHYWGYNRRRSGGGTEYRVEHARWQVWAASNAAFEGDASAVYGPPWAPVLARKPDSAFLADGGPVLVYSGHRIC